MKKNLLILLAMVSCSAAFAQPTLTQANSAPQVGSSYSFRSTTFPALSSAGANQTWNFASAPATAAPTTYSVVLPSTLTQTSSFPSANIGIKDAQGTEEFYISSANSLELIGRLVQGTLFEYSDNERFMEYPFTFGNTFTDSWASTFTSGTLFNRGGTSQWTADGYGTIMLPNGTFSNVLRVKLEQNYTDSAMGNLFATYVVEVINYYLPGHSSSIAASSSLMINAIPSGPYDLYMDPIWPTAVNEIKNLASFISFYPNPANDRLNIKAKESMQDAEIILCTMNGAQLLVQPLANGVTSIDVSSLSSGTYLMHLRSKGHNIAGEIVAVKH